MASPQTGERRKPGHKASLEAALAGRGLAGCRGGCALMKGPPGGTALTCFGSRGNVRVIKAPSLPVKFPSLPGAGCRTKAGLFLSSFPRRTVDLCKNH